MDRRKGVLMAEISIKNSHTMLFGLKGAGKSNWLQWLLSKRRYSTSHVCFDVCREHDSLNQYLPRHRRGKEGRQELEQVLTRLITDVERERRPEVVAIEEISRYAPSNGATSEALMELCDLNRHYGVGLVGVARRPAQVESDLVELADQLVIFNLRGKNDIRRLNNERAGLGDMIVNEVGEYEYAVVDGQRNVSIHNPVAEMDTTGRL